MLRNYWKTAVRTLTRERVFAGINLVGLTLGIACALVLTTFLREEVSYDRFHENADRIYRVISEDSLGGDLMRNANILGFVAPRYEERVSQIEESVRMHREQVVLNVDGKLFEESDFFWSDPSVFDIFDCPLEDGDPATALSRPNTVVITRAMAERLFGSESPMGKTIQVDSKRELEVTGILREPPALSHLHPTMLASFLTLGEVTNPWVGEFQGWSYVLLAPGADAAATEAVMNDAIREVVTWLNLDALYWRFRLQPLADVRLHSAGIVTAGDVGDIRYVYLFSIITGLILLIACVNFTNLATARSLKRMREVAMRKTLGASRRQIARQFLGESVGFALMASFAALVLVRIFRPNIAAVFGRPINVDLISDPAMGLWLLALAIGTGAAAGMVPAIFVSRFDPIRALKGVSAGKRRRLLPRLLIVGQFAISAGLIFMSVVIGRQMRYIQEKNLGFLTEGVVSIPVSGAGSDIAVFKQQVQSVPGVVAASYSGGLPMNGGLSTDSEQDGVKVAIHRLPVDEDYLEATGLELESGRFYDSDLPGDTERSVVVTESFVRFRKWENPLSESLVVGIREDGSEKRANVVGVVRDFHTGSFHQEIVPVIFDASSSWQVFKRALVVRFSEGSLQSAVARIESIWKNLVPDRPFSIRFADEYVKSQYEADLRQGSLFNFFMWLSIGIAALGLFGLAAYSAERRTREIGIRKVLGAGAGRIALMLSGEYIGLVAISVLVGLPVAYLASRQWLDTFAYRADVTPDLFILSALAVLTFALTAVLIQAFRGASADPVRSLRHD